jgi:thiaminase
VALAAVLPCFTIYLEVGTLLQAGLPPTTPASPADGDGGGEGGGAPHPYAEWIGTYGGDAFRTATARTAALADRLAAAAGPAARAAMRAAFLEAARHEFLFWDAAHRRERWPLSLAGDDPAPAPAPASG